jgi:hypothetical protein
MNIHISKEINLKKRNYEELLAVLTLGRNGVRNAPEGKGRSTQTAENNDFLTAENEAENLNYFQDGIIENEDLVHESVPIFKFAIERLILNFDIIPIVKMYGRKILRNDGLKFSDDKYPLTNTSKITKGSFARVLNQWCEDNKVTKKGSLDLLTIMHNAFGNVVRLPVRSLQHDDENKTDDINDDLSIQSLEMFTSQTVHSTMEDYDQTISRFFAFHQCFNDCSVFVGDSSKSFQCQVCSSFRFKPCTRFNCAKRGHTDCEHLLADGIPVKQFYFRPLILLILDLVRTKWFIKALNYQRKDFQKLYDQGPSIAEGKVAEENLNEMRSNYDLWKRTNHQHVNSESVNILFSEFYDGAQLFHRRMKDFNCIVTSILNLPPTFKGKEGISTFISAVYEGKHRFAEQVLFSEMYVEELQKLYRGIEFNFEGKVYFIQARLVLHIMDTKAAEGVYKLSNCANSTQGCPCCELIHGVHEGSKCVYLGHRAILPLRHFLRPIGQSKSCCPPGFYSENRWFSMETFSVDKNQNGQNMVRTVHEDNKRDRSHDNYCLPCDGDRERQSYLKDSYVSPSSESQLQWFHTGDFNLEAISNPTTGLKKILFYRHYDFREYTPYKRYPYENHMNDALQAELNLTALPTKSSKKHKSVSVNGIKGIWPFARYPIADISRHSGPPAIHAMTGCIRMLLDILLGEYVLKASKGKKGIPIKDHVADLNSDNIDIAESEDEDEDDEQVDEEEKEAEISPTKVYKPLFRPSNDPKCSYTAKKHDVRQITYWLRCILLPKGMNDDSWSIRLDSIGSLKMNQKLKMLSCFWDLMLLGCPSIDPSYKLFYRMFAADLKVMQRLYLTADDVDHLQNCVLETVSSWEGVLPPKTVHYKVHQLVDLPSMFTNFGTLVNFGEFAGERMMGMVKNLKLHSNTGGCSYGNTIMRKQIRRELRIMNKFYSRPVNDSDRHAPNGKHLQILDGDLLFNDFPFSLSGKKTHQVELRPFEIVHLVEILLYEIQKRFSFNEDECKAQSVLYGLIKRKKATSSSYIATLHSVSNSTNGEYSPQEKKVAESLMKGAMVFRDSACIYGLDFCSRGFAFREIEPAKVKAWGAQHGQQRSYDVRRDGQQMKWHEKASYSSWCMYRGLNDKIKFGQLNGFFPVFIGDSAIDGLLVASVTTRGYIIKEHVPFVEEYNSLDPRQNFVSLQDICPTLIGIVPFHRTVKGLLKAISLNSNISATVITDKTFDPAHIYNQKENIYAYAMIVLHPEKMSCQPRHRPFNAFY